MLGDRRALDAIRAARAADAKSGGLFGKTCLGRRIQEAEQRILARS